MTLLSGDSKYGFYVKNMIFERGMFNMLKNKLKRWLSAAVSAVMICGSAELLPDVLNDDSSFKLTAEAAASDFTAEQGAQWGRDRVAESWEVDVDGVYGCQCVDLPQAYGKYLGVYVPSLMAYEYETWGLPSGWTRTYGSPRVGDIFVMNRALANNSAGHVGLVTGVNGSSVTTAETNYWPENYGNAACRSVTRDVSKYTCFIHPNFKTADPTPTGKEMSAGAGQTIRDGDYMISSGLRQNLYLDAEGVETDAADKTNVSVYGNDVFPLSDVDIWTVTYQGDGYYRIKQKTSDSYVDCGGTANALGANIHMWHNSGGINSEWSIRNKATGYWIQGRANSWFMDVAGAATDNGTNVQNWSENDTSAQAWCFIPANPAANVKDGIYRIHSAVDSDSVLDSSGNVGEYKDGSNVQIWDKSGDDVFQVTHDANGYYYITEVSSGLALDIDLGDSNYLTNSRSIVLQTKADKRSQRWAILNNADGTYTILSQLNGYALDLAVSTVDVKPEKGTNITQFPNHNNANQRWTLEPVKLQSIKVDKVPDKTTYYPDEAFDPTGITVNAKYSGDYSFKIAKGLTYEYDLSKSGKNTVTVSYDINGQTLTDTFEVTVNEIDFKGSGTKSDPYLIENKSDLEKLRDLVNSEAYAPAFKSCYYLQTVDIDLNDEKWTPIGKARANGEQTASLRFEGHYDGGQHWIYGLNVNEETKFAGLFGNVNSGTVENLAVEGVVSGDDISVGGIVGEIQGATISGCCFIGDVTGGSTAAGGIVGYMWQGGTVQNCYHIGSVKTSDTHSAGGVIGRIQSNEIKNAVCTVENCYHIGQMESGQTYAKTLVGAIDKADTNVGQRIELINCYGINTDGGLYAGDKPDTDTAQAVKGSVLKLMAPTLGDAYVKNTDSNYLDGYPVFPWQTRLVGDVNVDGTFNISDAVLLQKWLLAVPDTHLANWKAADMCEDNKLDVFDLCMMKSKLING